MDISHALATATTVRTPCSDDRVIYSETKFTPDSKQGNLVSVIYALITFVRITSAVNVKLDPT